MTPQELKESILFLAAQGKLVPQLESEGFAQDIITTISSHRASLEKKGHLKKRKVLPEISEDEIPFDIPKSWIWVRVYDLADICETPFADGPFGSNLKSEHYTSSQEVRLIQLSNIGENGWKDRNVKYTTYEHLKTIQRSEVTAGDIVIAKMMPAGRAIIVPQGESKYVLSSDAVKFVAHPILDKMYLYYVINSQAFRNQVYSEVQGITRVRTSLQKLIKYLIPLPPLAEQERIVAKIEELLPYIDRYEKAWSKLEDFNKSFPGYMQKSILQMAIQGKLVEQRSEEGTGEELYQQIQAEKKRLINAGTIKKEKPVPEITEDEKPFDIPESWKWVRFANLCSVLTCGYASTPTYVSKEDGMPFISAKNVKPYRFLPDDHRYISHALYEQLTQNAKPEIGDILLTRVGAGIGEAAIIDVEFDFAIYVSLTLIKLVNSKLIDNKYILFWLNSPLGVMSAKRNIYGKNASQGNLNVNNVRDFIIPLPPIAEQKRIVAKLEEIIPLCEKLK